LTQKLGEEKARPHAATALAAVAQADESYLTTTSFSTSGDISVDVPPIYEFDLNRIKFVDRLDARQSPVNLLACVVDTPKTPPAAPLPAAEPRNRPPRKFLLADADEALVVNVWGERGDAYAAYLRVGDIVYLSGIISLVSHTTLCVVLIYIYIYVYRYRTQSV
jgi:hypothetical protein